ncbi:Band 7 domain-containing protein [Plasmodiophora brassicae]|uniref:Uncharacterized protein n=1 Tax=Plasmodiophora brassicae TaxID=37360 RepID=A0A0G4IW54_PLABS|nr:hypothetical protein PBRA_001202 [Plasmodiophora brassicae]SPQ97313.1 unnamed protein product [Plasmodiophora brassicae]
MAWRRGSASESSSDCCTVTEPGGDVIGSGFLRVIQVNGRTTCVQPGKIVLEDDESYKAVHLGERNYTVDLPTRSFLLDDPIVLDHVVLSTGAALDLTVSVQVRICRFKRFVHANGGYPARMLATIIRERVRQTSRLRGTADGVFGAKFIKGANKALERELGIRLLKVFIEREVDRMSTASWGWAGDLVRRDVDEPSRPGRLPYGESIDGERQEEQEKREPSIGESFEWDRCSDRSASVA